MNPKRRLLLPLLALLLGGAAVAEEPTPAAAPAAFDSVPLPHLANPVTVDGVLDEEAWQGAVVVDRFYEIGPADRGEPPVRTVGLLAYDAEYLYVGARCFDPEPDRIRAPYVDRDRVSDQDFVQIDIDARDEGRWSMIFRVNPRGVQADGIYDEAVGLDDFSPDFHFESATRITDEGWTAEMRIPLSTLRYRGGDPQTWRVVFYRLYPRRYRYQIASAPIPRASNCWLCHSTRFTGIGDLPRGGGATYTPFFTADGSKAPGRSLSTTGDLELGGDVKWLPQPNLALDLTLNPDFSQVESDVPQIGINTRFALFYPEKRPFFLEGLDLWSSPIRVVHTRTITEPEWGARVTGRPGSSSYTLLAAGDRGGGSLILPGPDGSRVTAQPAEAFVFLGRYRQSLGRSSLGALATTREAGDGYFNRVGGVDFQWYPTAPDRLIGQLLWSATQDPGQPGRDGHALFLRWERTQRHLGWNLQVDDLARDFRADNGFVPQTGIRHVQAYCEYNVYPQGRLRRVWPRLYYDESREHGGGVVSQTSAVGIGIDGTVQAVLDWYFDDTARAADGRLFAQSYWWLSARFLPHRRVPYLKITARYGDELDIAGSRLGTGTAMSLLATVAATDRLQAELAGERRWLEVPVGGRQQRRFAATVSRARLLYNFTSRSFTRLVGEWGAEERASTTDNTFSASALYGYRLNWQSILYVGYGNTPAGGSDDRRQQEVFLKVAFAFRH